MTSLWLDLVTLWAEGPPVQTFSSFQIHPRREGPNFMPFFPILHSYVEIFLAALVLKKFCQFFK